MKFLHLSDLHIGKKVNGISMLQEQKYVLKQAVDIIKEQNINLVLIAGDVFDRAIPSIEAMDVFSSFLSELNILKVNVYIISGNHDNMDRLAYLSDLLHKTNIFISKPFTGEIEYYEYGDFNIYLLPYIYPALIRKYYPCEKISNYNDALKLLIQHTKLNKNKINILLSHQFVVSSNQTIVSDSEQKSVGGIDEIDYKVFKKFDYIALGHLHCPQKVGLEKIRYGGSILKYSFSEINQKKSFCVVNIKTKNDIEINLVPIVQKHDMKEYIGYIDEFLNKDFYTKIDKEDYIHFTLYDENVLDAKAKLSSIYPNIMLLEFDNTFTRNLNRNFDVDFKKQKTLVEHFCDFYFSRYDKELDFNKKEIVTDIYNSITKEDECAL